MWRLSAREKAAGTETFRTAGDDWIRGSGKDTVRVREGDFETVTGTEPGELEGGVCWWVVDCSEGILTA